MAILIKILSFVSIFISAYAIYRMDQAVLQKRGELRWKIDKINNHTSVENEFINKYWYSHAGDNETATRDQFQRIARDTFTGVFESESLDANQTFLLFEEFKDSNRMISKIAFVHIFEMWLGFYKENFDVMGAPTLKNVSREVLGEVSLDFGTFFFANQVNASFPLNSDEFFSGFTDYCNHFGFSSGLNGDYWVFYHFTNGRQFMDSVQMTNSIKFFRKYFGWFLTVQQKRDYTASYNRVKKYED